MDYNEVMILNPINNKWVTLEQFRNKDEDQQPDWVNAIMDLVQYNE